ncbi:MAG TPA: 30S ribosomal protein S6 [Myxococcota bacterium]|nr:30S ribosomal protein S6 [Myxococcota bacterium]
MREYEFNFVVQPEITEEGIARICERFEGIVERAGDTRLHYDELGRRRLAYEIRNFQKGHYLALHFLSDGKVVTELERAARIDDSILRFLTVVANQDVVDIEARKQEAVGLEEDRKRKAAERAAREAEEAAARAARDAEGGGRDEDEDSDSEVDPDRDSDRDRDRDRDDEEVEESE